MTLTDLSTTIVILRMDGTDVGSATSFLPSVVWSSWVGVWNKLNEGVFPPWVEVGYTDTKAAGVSESEVKT